MNTPMTFSSTASSTAVIVANIMSHALTSSPMPFAATRQRGHERKIAEALKALHHGDVPLHLLRPAELIFRCNDWLKSQGLGTHELPSDTSYLRAFRNLGVR